MTLKVNLGNVNVGRPTSMDSSNASVRRRNPAYARRQICHQESRLKVEPVGDNEAEEASKSEIEKIVKAEKPSLENEAVKLDF